MQYDDDIEESKVSESKQLAQPSQDSRPTKAASAKPAAVEEKKKQPIPEAAVSDDEEDDDDLMDDPMAFIERHDSHQQTDVAHLFEDDPKAKRRQAQNQVAD